MEPARGQRSLVEDDRRGRKNGRGFYRYEKKDHGFERSDGVDPSVYRVLDATPREEHPWNPKALARRCVLPMVDEALRCLEEGIVRSERDANVGAVFGLGFPPYRGGPLRWLDQTGVASALREMQELQRQHGERFEPSAAFRRRAEAASGSDPPAEAAEGQA